MQESDDGVLFLFVWLLCGAVTTVLQASLLVEWLHSTSMAYVMQV